MNFVSPTFSDASVIFDTPPFTPPSHEVSTISSKSGTRHRVKYQVSISHPVLQWREDDVLCWLRQIPFGVYGEEYIHKFSEAHIDGFKLLEITNEYLLREMKISLEIHRSKILASIRSVLAHPEISSCRARRISRRCPINKEACMEHLCPGLRCPLGGAGHSADHLCLYRGDMLGLCLPIDKNFVCVENTRVEIPPGANDILVPFSRVMAGKLLRPSIFGDIFLGFYQDKVISQRFINFSPTPPVMNTLLHVITKTVSLDHPNIVRWMGWTKCPVSIIAEYCSGGCLQVFLRSFRGRRLELDMILRFATDILNGLLYLHSNDVYGVLTSAFLFLDDQNRLKIGDFGMHVIFWSRRYVLNMANWLAPEACRFGVLTEKADVFSFGVVLWELLTLEHPWKRYLPVQICAAVCSGKRLEIPPAMEVDFPEMCHLIKRCWLAKPSSRPSVRDILDVLETMQSVQSKETTQSMETTECTSPE
eukprot:Rmarinus@m.12312